ncbi:class I SAM-dependent methyltransferase [Streptomyces sp. NPDC048172]|uniref:class I SAM-dependent methyltransferase n=1 Tax=Streptomyces sp. NPDC048172 TaxID=3365505 RepID=UPI00371C6489
MSAHHHHGHGHGHGHDGGGSGDGDYDFDWEAMADRLEREAELRADAMEESVAWLRGLLLEGGCGAASVGRVIDLGSGPGVSTAALAHGFPQAETVAVDGAEGLLDRARARAAREGLADRVTALRAELPEGLAGLGAADLVWTSHVVHHLGDQRAALGALARTLNPGGVLAVREGGLPLRFLPRDIGLGRPGLQARLDAANEEWFGEMRDDLPDAVRTVEDWPAMLTEAGLTPAGSRTFVTELRAPLGAAAREHLVAYTARAREVLADRLAKDDVETLDALLDDASPHSLRTRPDAFLLVAATVHAGMKRTP